LTKTVLRKTTSAIFLVIVLVVGTFAAISPSFPGVNAQSGPYNYGMDDRYSDYRQDYGMDDSYDKKPYEPKPKQKTYGNNYEQDYPSYNQDYSSYGKDNYGKDRGYDKSNKDSNRSDLLKKLKCNNINANLNNVDANFGTPIPSDGTEGGANGEALAAQGSEAISANGLMNGASNGDRSFVDRENNFAFVCINNNNNTVVEAPSVEDECPEADEIESCFRQVLSDSLFPRFVEALESEAGITVEINGQEVTLRSFEDICFALEGLTFEQLTIAIGDIIAGAEIELTFPSLSGLIQCISTALDIDLLSQ